MFRNIIAPVQAWLLVQGRCVGCGATLKAGKVKKIDEKYDKVTCFKCQRIFIFDKSSKRYRRALSGETK